MSEYLVIVGNVGTVYCGSNGRDAVGIYLTYVVLSKEEHGRVANEPVTLMRDGEPIREYEPY